MNLLPHLKFEIRTPLSQEEIEKRVVETPNYKGSVQHSAFKMQRIITYRNSFLPLIEGNIRTQGRESIVEITMKLYLFTYVFMGFWLLGVILFSAVWFFMGSDTPVPFPFSLIPLWMLIIGVGLFIIPFRIESSKSQKDLLALLDGEVIKED